MQVILIAASAFGGKGSSNWYQHRSIAARRLLRAGFLLGSQRQLADRETQSETAQSDPPEYHTGFLYRDLNPYLHPQLPF